VTQLRHVEQCMGTVFSFDIREPGVDPSALRDALVLLHRLDAMFSTYRDDSEISRLNRDELSLEDASAELRYVLAECERWRLLTDGWFSVRAGGALDPSGYVKGWAIQRVSDLLSDAGSASHCINGGGDVQTVGTRPDGEPWRVGVADPRDRSSVVATLVGNGIAIATSGTAERGSHIIDPHTGQPATGTLLSLTVSGNSVLECDIYATAGFAMGAGARGWFARAEGISVFAVEPDGSTWSTRGSARVEPGQLPAR
jgi:thiamine biosynthesis lipoprotein